MTSEATQKKALLTKLHMTHGAGEESVSLTLAEAANEVLRENNPVGVAAGEYDDAFTITSFSDYFVVGLGYEPETFAECTGMSLKSLMVASELFPFTEESFRALKGTGVFYMRAADGTPRLMHAVKRDIAGEDGRRLWVMSLRRDAHSQNLALVNRLFDNAYWTTDYDESGSVADTSWSSKLQSLFGLDDATAADRVSGFLSIVHPEDLDAVHAFFLKRIPEARPGDDSCEFECRLRVKNRWEWFRSSVYLVRRADGTVCQALGVIYSVDEEKAEEAREVRHETVLRAFSDGNLCEFFVDLQTDAYECFKASASIQLLVDGTPSWDAFIDRLSEECVHVESRDAFRRLLSRSYIRENLQLAAGGLSGDVKLEVNGSVVWVRCAVLPADGLCHVLVYLRDITVSKLREAERNELSREKAGLDQLVRGVTRMVNRFIVCDLASGAYQYYSFENDRRYRPQGRYMEILARMDETLMPIGDDASRQMSDFLTPSSLRRKLRSETDVCRFDYCTQDKSAFMVLSIVPIEWTNGLLTKVMLVSEDSSQKHALEVLANTDSLTGLLNARNLSATLKQLHGKPFALFYLDLNGFKSVNDACGHDVGDLLLKAVSDRLTGCVRSEDKVFRVGGDEFCIVTAGTPSEADCLAMVERVKEAVSAPYLLATRELRVTTSCGWAKCPADSASPEEVRILADHRMYEDKVAMHEEEAGVTVTAR